MFILFNMYTRSFQESAIYDFVVKQLNHLPITSGLTMCPTLVASGQTSYLATNFILIKSINSFKMF